jgi:hypothetical protein
MINPLVPIAIPPILHRRIVVVSTISRIRLYCRIAMMVAVVPTAIAMLAGTIQSSIGCARMYISIPHAGVVLN